MESHRIKQDFGVRKFANEVIDVRLCVFGCVQQPAETACTASVVSTAGTTSTRHASAEGTAHLEKLVSQLLSLMSTLQDCWKEALAAGIDGKIKLQAAELQELEDARQKAWINECAAVTDKLAAYRGAGAA